MKKKKNLGSGINSYCACLCGGCYIHLYGGISKTYGEIERDLNDVPMPNLWKKMDKKNIGFKTCRGTDGTDVCNKSFKTLTDLSKHKRNECMYREVWCGICKKTNQVIYHKQNCKIKCHKCNEEVYASTEFKENNYSGKYILVHDCSKVTKTGICCCGTEINNTNRHEHDKCWEDEKKIKVVIFTSGNRRR